MYYKNISYTISHMFVMLFIYLFVAPRYSKPKTAAICIISFFAVTIPNVLKLNIFPDSRLCYLLVTIYQIALTQLTGIFISVKIEYQSAVRRSERLQLCDRRKYHSCHCPYFYGKCHPLHGMLHCDTHYHPVYPLCKDPRYLDRLSEGIRDGQLVEALSDPRIFLLWIFEPYILSVYDR